jgi:hypothetical protein
VLFVGKELESGRCSSVSWFKSKESERKKCILRLVKRGFTTSHVLLNHAHLCKNCICFQPSRKNKIRLAQRVTAALSSGIKWMDREVNHSTPASARIKNAWSFLFNPLAGLQLERVVLRKISFIIQNFYYESSENRSQFWNCEH